MPRDATVQVGGSTWAAISDGAISEITQMQNQGQHELAVIWGASAPAADAAPDLIWPAGVVEFGLTVPNGPRTIYGRSLGAGSISVKIIHA